jgi:hypothetical protein
MLTLCVYSRLYSMIRVRPERPHVAAMVPIVLVSTGEANAHIIAVLQRGTKKPLFGSVIPITAVEKSRREKASKRIVPEDRPGFTPPKRRNLTFNKTNRSRFQQGSDACVSRFPAIYGLLLTAVSNNKIYNSFGTAKASEKICSASSLASVPNREAASNPGAHLV